MKRTIFIVSLIASALILSINVKAQNKLRITGFMEYLNNTWIPSSTYQSYGFTDWQNQSTIYNRINLWWTPVNNLEFHAGMRNNFTFGPLVAQYNNFFKVANIGTYADLVTYDDGYLDLTWFISGDNSNVLYTNLDRLNMKWTSNKFELTIGRQRINWGTNLVWNPNDIFNASIILISIILKDREAMLYF